MVGMKSSGKHKKHREKGKKAGLRHAAATHSISKRFAAQPIPISICIVQAVPSGPPPKTILDYHCFVQAMTNSDFHRLLQ
jgi:hypothetical protein